MKKFYIETFGCQMNELDSEKVAGLLSRSGMHPSPEIRDADIILYNTCSVREKAVQKVLSRLGELKALKKRKPDMIVAVLGCVAQQEGQNLIKRAPIIDMVTGPQKIYRIPSMIERIIREGGPLVETDFEKGPLPAEIDAVLRESSFRAKVTIQEGCDKFCTFCIVPFTRGREKNRPSHRILEEVCSLADHGYVEILLLGQNVNSYIDPSPRGMTFAELLREVGCVNGIRRVRFTSPHPSDYNEEILRVINEVPTVCNQVHLPLQSGSTTVLARMKRGYTREEYLRKVEMTQMSVRPVSISTDLIVGFPGESQEDFEQTLDVMGKVCYNQVYSFVYSPRPYTASIRMVDDVPLEEKKRRLAVLQESQNRIQLAINSSYLYKTVEVLVEGPARSHNQLVGRTSENVCVNFEGSLNLAGQFVEISIGEAYAHSLRGNWLGQTRLGEQRPVLEGHKGLPVCYHGGKDA